ncbi:MAG: FHA domain-containing protein [Thermoanaerobaculia bacterium]
MSQTGWQIFVEVPGKAPIELPSGESVIGRSRASLVQIAETTVSRQHAIFVVEPGKVRLRDLGSSNGTFVNGERVDGEIPLSDGDRVVVGEAELVLRMLAPLGPSEATAKMVIPPLSALSPKPAAVPPPAPMPAPSLAAPPAASSSPRISPESGSQAPWSPTPLSRNPASPAQSAPPPPAPTPSVAPPRTAPPAPVAAATAGAAGALLEHPAKKDGELLSSIRDIDLAPVPPPAPRSSPVGTPVVRATVPGKVEPAGFWLRVVASLIESIPFLILAATQFIVGWYVSPSLAYVVGLVQLAYGLLVVLVLPALKGTTPGKRLMKLWIVSESTVPGQGLGWTTALLRLVGYLACSATFGLGYLLVAFSARKQGLHDLIAKTNVVRKRANPA